MHFCVSGFYRLLSLSYFFVCSSLKVARGVVYVTAYISWEVWVHKTSLTRPHFIEVLVPSQQSERSCICVVETVDYSSASAIFLLDVGIFPIARYFYFLIFFYCIAVYFLHSIFFYYGEIKPETIIYNLSYRYNANL